MAQCLSVMQNTVQNDEQRISWIDIYISIVIFLLVIGHATGYFNSYIYQFHISALLFISGYIFQKGKRNILRTIWDGFYSLIIPFFVTFLLMIFLAAFLNRLGIYQFFFTDDMPYIGFGNSVLSLLLYGNCYAWWLYAGLLVIIIFTIEIIHSIILALSGDNMGLYFILIIILYCTGYYCVRHGYTLQLGIIPNDLVFIGSGFWGIGFLFHYLGIFEKIHSWHVHVIILIINISMLYYFASVHPTAVQYFSHVFNHPAIDLLIGLNGCLFVYFISVFFEKIKCIKKLLIYIRKNTLGIVFFHFQFFKIGYLILYLFNIVQLDFIKEFIPTDEIGKNWWWMLSIVSIFMSVVEWSVLTKIKGIRFLFGAERKLWTSIYDTLKNKLMPKKNNLSEYSLSEIGFKLREYLKTPYVCLGAFVVILICIPIWNQGVMCEDELIYDEWFRYGLGAGYKTAQQGWAQQGRFLASLLTPIWMWLGTIGRNIGEFRIIPVLSILFNIALFGILLYRLFRNKYFSLFCSFMLIAFLPITFAPMAPNAYTTTFCIPFSFLLGAMIMYIKYIDKPQISSGLLISIMMLISFSSYEIFVTYVPVFCLFVLLKKGVKNIKELVKLCILPILTGIVYIILYFLCQVWMPTNYAGNRIGFTVSGALQILFYLGKVSFPGYFLSSPTYKYLNTKYHNLQLIDYFRIAFLAIGLFILSYKLALSDRQEKIQNPKKTTLLIILAALFYTTIPALPVSISSQYQNNVGESTGNIGLPVTYFTYFSATFLCCYIVWHIFYKCKEAIISILLTIIIVFICVPLQYMNSNFSSIQNANFTRLQKIEDFLTTNTVVSLNGSTIYSEDIFKTYLSLGVNKYYWQTELSRRGYDIQVLPCTDETSINADSYYLSYVDDSYFVMEGQDVIYLAFTTTSGASTAIIELFDGTLLKAVLENPIVENNYYIYVFMK